MLEVLGVSQRYGSQAEAGAVGWLERLGLSERAQGRVEELSHGNQQRVQLILALLHTPELLVLDEAFSGLVRAAGRVYEGAILRTGVRVRYRDAWRTAA